MKKEHVLLLLEFHRKCNYKYTYPVQWSERLAQIKDLLNGKQNKPFS
jgi:hypothetical protein